MQYSQTGVGMSVISISQKDSSGFFYRIMCVTDSEGTNCSRNGLPWFACSPENALTYKGKVLTDTSEGVDDDICNTTYTAFNKLYIQNMAHNITALGSEFDKGFKSFGEELDAMMRQLHEAFQFGGKNFWKIFGDDNFPFPESDSSEPDDTERIDSKEESNEVERE